MSYHAAFDFSLYLTLSLPFPDSDSHSIPFSSYIEFQDILPLMIQNSESSSVGSSRSDKVGKGSDINLEPVESCSVTFSLNPATGLVTVSEQKGKLIRDRRADYWFRVQVICSILLLILLLLSPFLYNFFRERSVKAEHIKWLKSFYLMHAPEVTALLNSIESFYFIPILMILSTALLFCLLHL